MSTIELVLELFEPEPEPGALQSAVSDAVGTRLREFSGLIRESLLRLYVAGIERLQVEVTDLMAAFDALKEELGEKASDFELEALAFLNEKFDRLIEIAVVRFPPTIRRSEAEYRLDKLEISTKLALEASVRAALTEFLAIVCKGETEVKVHYARADARPLPDEPAGS